MYSNWDRLPKWDLPYSTFFLCQELWQAADANRLSNLSIQSIRKTSAAWVWILFSLNSLQLRSQGTPGRPRESTAFAHHEDNIPPKLRGSICNAQCISSSRCAAAIVTVVSRYSYRATSYFEFQFTISFHLFTKIPHACYRIAPFNWLTSFLFVSISRSSIQTR